MDPAVFKQLFEQNSCVRELEAAESHWLYVSQCDQFLEDIYRIIEERASSQKIHAAAFYSPPIFLDSHSLLRVGGRVQTTKTSSSSQHPVIIHGKHPVAKF